MQNSLILSLILCNAATAGEGTHNKSSGNTKSSICAKGWRLPTSAEYGFLKNKFNQSQIQQPPYSFTISGYYDSGRYVHVYSSSCDCYAQYATSTANSSDSPCWFHICPCSGYNECDTRNKYIGGSVRCVSKG